jgi:hypothetical protein
VRRRTIKGLDLSAEQGVQIAAVGLTGERQPPGEALVQHNAESEHVRPRVDRIS